MTFKHWLHHLFNPHCHICQKIQQEEFDFERDQFEQSKVCRSCENLKMELAHSHRLNKELIDKLTEKPLQVERDVVLTEDITRTLKTPWKLKRQLLEEADRQEAEIRRGVMASVSVVTEDDLDKELKELDATTKSVS